MTVTEIRRTLKEAGLRPLKQLGQNFLHDRAICSGIVREALAHHPTGELLLEVGPGLGALTECVLEDTDAQLLAVEIDRGYAQILHRRFNDLGVADDELPELPLEALQAGLDINDRFRLIQGDALMVVPQIAPTPRTIMGNLPYNISTSFIMTCLELDAPPDTMVFTLQLEMGQRLAARPKDKKSYNAVSVLVQTMCEVDLVKRLPPSVFYPAPEVDSAVVRLRLRPQPLVPHSDRAAFAKLVKQAFSQRRKKLSNCIGLAGDNRRPGALEPEEWASLFQEIQAARKG